MARGEKPTARGGCGAEFRVRRITEAKVLPAGVPEGEVEVILVGVQQPLKV
jgi:hypothetical protein